MICIYPSRLVFFSLFIYVFLNNSNASNSIIQLYIRKYIPTYILTCIHEENFLRCTEYTCNPAAWFRGNPGLEDGIMV